MMCDLDDDDDWANADEAEDDDNESLVAKCIKDA